VVLNHFTVPLGMPFLLLIFIFPGSCRAKRQPPKALAPKDDCTGFVKSKRNPRDCFPAARY